MRHALPLAAMLLAACGGTSGPGDGSALPVLYEGHPLTAVPWSSGDAAPVTRVTFEATGRIAETVTSASTYVQCVGATWAPESMGRSGMVTLDYSAERCEGFAIPSSGGSARSTGPTSPLHSGSMRVPYAITACDAGGDCALRLVAGPYALSS